jgi:hypothetical protein
MRGDAVFMLSSHVQRLATSANLMVDADTRVRSSSSSWEQQQQQLGAAAAAAALRTGLSAAALQQQLQHQHCSSVVSANKFELFTHIGTEQQTAARGTNSMFSCHTGRTQCPIM